MHGLRAGTFLLMLLLIGSTVPGCVKRIWEAPGLEPGSPYAVSSDMRVETFEAAEREIQVFRMEVSGTNRRRYQFVIYHHNIHEIDFTLDLTAEGVWELIERRPDGISVTRRTYESEPSYAVVKAEVVRLLGGS